LCRPEPLTTPEQRDVLADRDFTTPHGKKKAHR
jgi:hypothetical protein